MPAIRQLLSLWQLLLAALCVVLLNFRHSNCAGTTNEKKTYFLPVLGVLAKKRRGAPFD